MIIENKKTASYIRLGILVLPVLYAILFSLSYLLGVFPNYPYFISLVISFLIIVFILAKLKLYYIICSVESGKFTFRYLSFGPMGGKRSSIQFPQKDFVKYELLKSFYGYKTEIIIYRQTPKGTAKYPPVSISSFSKQQIDDLEKMLKNLIHFNRTNH